MLRSGPLGESSVRTDRPSPVLPDGVRERIEARYWAPIGAAAQLERWIDDGELHRAPERHPALFSDHGVVHVRDIAGNTGLLAENLNGSLLRWRDEAGMRFVTGIAVLQAYVHDIGMVETTASARRIHPQFAAQVVLGVAFDDLADALWDADAAGLRTRVEATAAIAPLRVSPRLVAREVIALAFAHSKSLVPAPLLDDRLALRAAACRAACTALEVLEADPGTPGQERDVTSPSPVAALYDDPERDAFAWLVDDAPAMADLAGDVVDAVRVLRAADALRQRGTTLRTSAGYELCVDRATGELVAGLRTADERMALLLRFENPIGAAEANLRGTWLTGDGRLAVGFYRGSFAVPGVRERLVTVTADVVADIEADAIGSFSQAIGPSVADRTIDLSPPPDDPSFAEAVAAAIAARHPHLRGSVRTVDAADEAPAAPDVSWAAGGRRLEPHDPETTAMFARLAEHGLRSETIDPAAALAGAHVVAVAPGTTVLQAGSAASLVVVPLGPGLAVVPSGGYAPRPLPAWQPVGVTGVVRGGARNAAVVCEAAVDVLVVPDDVYLAEWYRPYDLASLRHGLHERGRRA